MAEKQQRKKAREAVLQALYAKYLSSEDQNKVLRDINNRYNFDNLTKEFVNELFQKTIDNNEMLDQKIENSLENWDLERINVIDRLIMQMSISEMLFMKQLSLIHI